MILRQQRARECDHAVRYRKTENDHVADIDSHGANHLVVIAGRAHCRSKIRTKEEIQRHADEHTDEQHENQNRSIVQTHFPAEYSEADGAAAEALAQRFGVAAECRLRNQRHIALAHHMEIDGIERRHHQNPGEQTVDLKFRVQNAGCSPGHHAPQKSERCGQQGINTRHQRSCGNRGAQRDRAFRSDIGDMKHAKADEHSHRQQGKNQSDGE